MMSNMNLLLDRNLANAALKKIDTNKILFIVGPRKSGKTLLINDVLGRSICENSGCKRYNCDVYNVRKTLENRSAEEIYEKIREYSHVVFEEAQNLENLDTIIKAADTVYNDAIAGNDGLRIIFTLSSIERRKPKYLQAMRGKYEIFYVLPLCVNEIASDSHSIDFDRVMRYGLYPEVYYSREEDAKEVLEEILHEDLCRDIMMNAGINKIGPLWEILRILALHIGDEISISKLSKYCDLDDRTVERYLDFLIESFIVFRHRPLNRRGKHEVKVRDKYYFWDLGIRNALIENFGAISNRIDRDMMWENLCLAERKKALRLKGERFPSFFWRTHSDQNVDHIEEENTWLIPYSFKWNDFQMIDKLSDQVSTPSAFRKLYGIEKQMQVSQANLMNFLKQ